MKKTKHYAVHTKYAAKKYAVKDAFINIKKAFLLLFKKPKYLFLIMAFDLMFFFFYGFVSSKLFSKITEYMYAFGNKITMYSIKNPSAIPFSAEAMSESSASGLLFKIILLLAILIVSIYIIYSFFQGFSWAFSRKIIDADADIYTYAKRFFAANILWFGLYVVYEAISYSAGFIFMLRARSETSPQSIIAVVFLVILAYFTFISYSLEEKSIRNSFKMGFKKFPHIALCYILIAAVFIVVNLILKLFSAGGFGLFILGGIILLLPAVAWARVYLMLNVGKLRDS